MLIKGLCENSFPGRLAFRLLNELSEAYFELKQTESLPKLGSKASKLLGKYNDPGVDKLYSVQVNLAETKEMMSKNMDKLIENNADLKELETEAIGFRANAKKFKSTSKKVERQMFWKKIRQVVYIILIVLAIILFIIVMNKIL